MRKFEDFFWETKGFEELKRLSKQSNDFSKEVISIIQERAKLEQTYADSLGKLASKAGKISKDGSGSLLTAWGTVASEMEKEAELRRSVSQGLTEEVVKHAKTFADNQIKARKPLEINVDKAHKAFLDKRSDENKAKKISHSKAKECENLLDLANDARTGKGKPMSEKEINKLDAKVKKIGESSQKADKEYRDLNLQTERSRVQWETALLKCCQMSQRLEEERISYFKDVIKNYGAILRSDLSKFRQCFDTVCNGSGEVNSSVDVDLMAEERGTERSPSEQILYDCFEMDMDNSMDASRRKEALECKIQEINGEIEKEMKARSGITNLLEAYQTTPDFCSDEAHMDVTQQLASADAIINSLEASLFNLQAALATVAGQGRPSHRLMNYIEQQKDKQGMLVSTLKVPLDKLENRASTRVSTRAEAPRESVDYNDDGHSDDEFDDDQPAAICKCEAKYDYNAVEKDELSIRAGDLIDVLSKNGDGWWQGELRGQTGLFPASYVEEVRR